MEQIPLNLWRKDVIRETLVARRAMFFDTGAAADRLLKKFMKSGSFMAPIVTSVRRITDSNIVDQNTLLA